MGGPHEKKPLFFAFAKPASISGHKKERYLPILERSIPPENEYRVLLLLSVCQPAILTPFPESPLLPWHKILLFPSIFLFSPSPLAIFGKRKEEGKKLSQGPSSVFPPLPLIYKVGHASVKSREKKIDVLERERGL